MSEPPDEMLARRVVEGDDTAFAEIVDRYQGRMYAWLRQRRGPRSGRESQSDVLQDIWLHVHRGLAGFEDRGEGSFRAWLFAVANNSVRNHRRTQGAERRTPAREEYVSIARLYGGIVTPSGALDAKERVERFEVALRELSEQDREIVLMAKVEGQSAAAIGARLGKSPEAVRKALSRALVRLAQRVRES